MPNVEGKRPDGTKFTGLAIKLGHGITISWDGRIVRHCTSVLCPDGLDSGNAGVGKDSTSFVNILYGVFTCAKEKIIRAGRAGCAANYRPVLWLPKNQLKKWQLLLSPTVCACQSALSRSLNRFSLGERGNREWSQKWGPRRLGAVLMANGRPYLNSLQQLTWKLLARTMYQEKNEQAMCRGLLRRLT